MIFKDRVDAGKKLAKKMQYLKEIPNAIILGLPRGGVITAQAIADIIKLPLDIIVARKIGAPGNEEFAIGAITYDNQLFIDENTVKAYDIAHDYIEKETAIQKIEADRRHHLYRGNRPPLDLKQKTAVIVDDGIATGATMQAAILSAKFQGAAKIIVAIPVIARDSLEMLKQKVDEVIYLDAPLMFGAVGSFYQNFKQTTDQEVIKIMS
ncbi:MAG: hypothetical protein ACD_72C00016G0003 [uncultured bacterium]|nr:MAG: hypothetical protein ACD_72C00016G0003 [uncultured bacterium]